MDVTVTLILTISMALFALSLRLTGFPWKSAVFTGFALFVLLVLILFTNIPGVLVWVIGIPCTILVSMAFDSKVRRDMDSK